MHCLLADRGYTWTKTGAQTSGYAGSAAYATGWLSKWVSTWYDNRVLAANIWTSGGFNQGLPTSGYTGDQWTSSGVLGTWAHNTTDVPSGWASTDLLPGCIIKDGSTYIKYVEGAAGGAYSVGYQTASSPGGTYTYGGLRAVRCFPDGRDPENPKVFADPLSAASACSAT